MTKPMSDQQPNEIHLEQLTIEDPLLNGQITVQDVYAYNMTEQEIAARVREIFSNPEVRKKMAQFKMQIQSENN